MIKTLATRIVAPLLAIVALWGLVTSTLWYCVELLFGARVADGFFPFLNAHILERLVAGTYAPLSDPPFLIRVGLIAVMPFGVVTYLAARNASPAQRWLSLVPTFIALAILGCFLSFAWTDHYPKSVRVGAIAELSAYLTASCIGLLIAPRRGSPSRRGTEAVP